MADEEAAPAEERDEPTQAAASAPEEQESPDVGTSADKPDDHFDERFDPAALSDELRGEWKSMKGSLTRRQQDLAEERRQLREAQEVYEALQDPDRQADALRRLGLEFEEPEDDTEYDDPYEQLRQEVEELKAERQQEMSAAEEHRLEEAEIDFINQGLGELTQRTGRDDFSEEEIQAIGDLSRVRRTPEGLPDVEGAYELLYTGVLPRERERWVNSKKSPQAPSGSSAVEVPDLDTDKGKEDYMAHRFAEIYDANPGN